MGTYVSSLQVNPLDLSPNYAGMLTAIVGTIESLFGIIVPKIVDVMLPNVCLTNIILREHSIKIICLNLIHFTTHTHKFYWLIFEYHSTKQNNRINNILNAISELYFRQFKN